MADTDTTTPPPAATPPATGTPPPTSDDYPADLGETGRNALDRMKAERTAAKAETAALRAELDEYRQQSMTDQEKAIAAAREEGAASVTSKVNERILIAEIRAAAAGKLADPADGVLLLDPKQFTILPDGTVDTAEIATAIEALLKAKPYLASSKPPPTPGSADQGAKGTAGKQITRDDLKGMTSAQINQARIAGQLDHLLTT